VRAAWTSGREHSPASWVDREFKPPWLLRPFVESVEVGHLADPKDRFDLRIGSIVGNYGDLSELLKEPHTIPLSRLHDNDVQKRLQESYVIMGLSEGASTGDLFCVPGFDRPISGTYLHAIGVTSLLRRPLLRLTKLGRAVTVLLLLPG